jgi:hypothetical protein
LTKDQARGIRPAPLAHGLPPVHRHQTNQQHEARIRALQVRKRPINVLSTNSAWLLSSLVLGCNGVLSGSVIADLQAKPPLVKISDAEIARIRNALIEAGLLGARTAQGRNAA